MDKHNEMGRQVQFTISSHAEMRMNARGISREALNKVVQFGRINYARGARIYALGDRDVHRVRAHGIRIENFKGIHVVCSPDNHVLTVYRNQDFSGLRPGRRRYRSARSRKRAS